MSKSKYFLYGASGHGKVILESLEASGEKIEGFFDDAENLPDKILGASTLGGFSKFSWNSEDKMIISIGNNLIRKKISEQLNVVFGKAIHPKSMISKSAVLDKGTVVMSGVSINAESKIGKHCIINTNASIDHDCEIQDFVHISPNVGLAGNVFVGEKTHVGIGANIIQGIRIGENVTIGAGAVIIKDVPDNAVVVGNPGKIIKYNK